MDRATHVSACTEYARMRECCGFPNKDEERNKRSWNEENMPPTEGHPTSIRKKVCRVSPAVAKERPATPLRDITPAYMNVVGFGSGSPLSAEQALWICLCCGKSECRYENGITLFNEEETPLEHDPCEIKVQERRRCFSETDYMEEGMVVRNCTKGLLRSKKFFAHNKYIGTLSLDRKLKEWLNQHLSEDIIQKNWPSLRQAAKETLRYKRLERISFVRDAFVGKIWAPPICFCVLSFAKRPHFLQTLRPCPPRGHICIKPASWSLEFPAKWNLPCVAFLLFNLPPYSYWNK